MTIFRIILAGSVVESDLNHQFLEIFSKLMHSGKELLIFASLQLLQGYVVHIPVIRHHKLCIVGI